MRSETREELPASSPGGRRAAAEPAPVLARLAEVSGRQGLGDMAERLLALRALTADDMGEVERALATLPRGPSRVRRAGGHLLAQGGKRLRPLCVALAARCGFGPSAAARELATAVELVHAATLLHDDVVDAGERRRGADAARVLYGNTASIFAGDWLLVEALRRVRGAGVPGTLERLFDVIDEMIEAESLQLEHRGRLDLDAATYFRIVEGKTASLFRWAMFAGGRAGGLGDEGCAALEGFGQHLGVAFQVVDDVLDLSGSEASTGKGLLADLAEGKMTYPLLVGLARDPEVRPLVDELTGLGQRGLTPPQQLLAQVVAALRRSGSLDEGRALARERARQAAAALAPLPPTPAREALAAVVEATVDRDR